jgi:hypothetical protein
MDMATSFRFPEKQRQSGFSLQYYRLPKGDENQLPGLMAVVESCQITIVYNMPDARVKKFSSKTRVSYQSSYPQHVESDIPFLRNTS